MSDEGKMIGSEHSSVYIEHDGEIVHLQPGASSLMEIDVKNLPSPVLRRLIEEVRNDGDTGGKYNRWHNRHNRSR